MRNRGQFRYRILDVERPIEKLGHHGFGVLRRLAVPHQAINNLAFSFIALGCQHRAGL
jgi:hypothetical protein